VPVLCDKATIAESYCFSAIPLPPSKRAEANAGTHLLTLKEIPFTRSSGVFFVAPPVSARYWTVRQPVRYRLRDGGIRDLNEAMSAKYRVLWPGFLSLSVPDRGPNW